MILIHSYILLSRLPVPTSRVILYHLRFVRCFLLLSEILPLEIQLGLAFDGELVIRDMGGEFVDTVVKTIHQ